MKISFITLTHRPNTKHF